LLFGLLELLHLFSVLWVEHAVINLWLHPVKSKRVHHIWRVCWLFSVRIDQVCWVKRISPSWWRCKFITLARGRFVWRGRNIFERVKFFYLYAILRSSRFFFNLDQRRVVERATRLLERAALSFILLEEAKRTW